MPSIPWSSHINFPSALLLHSCTTILLKETLNCLEITRRLSIRQRKVQQKRRVSGMGSATETSAILDAYTSIFSGDVEGEQSELYFTNTGLALLAASLASSVAMNLLLSDLVLNMIIAGTFGLTFAASLVAGRAKYTLPFMALRRAGRFIWSDTPFVNFFSLIYIATVLKGQSTLRLQDYITFRSIAVFELALMKAKLASADCETQISLMRKLIVTERVILHAVRPKNTQCPLLMKRQERKTLPLSQNPPILARKDIKAFSTAQRLSVMFCKTSVGYEFGCVTGASGPTGLPLPAIGVVLEDSALAWKLCRFSEDVMILVDCHAESKPTSTWSRITSYMHGILLRRLGKKRVVYLVRQSPDSNGQEPAWHSNVNLVTGVDTSWLDEAFSPGQAERTCAVAVVA